MSKKYKICLAMLCSILLLLSNTAYAVQISNYQTKAKSNNKQNTSQINTKQEDTTKKAGWKLKDINSWYYYDQNGKLKTGWLHYKTGKYYLNTKAEGKEGLMRLGWYTDKKGDKYFFNTIYGVNFGKAVTGWNWIAGHKYYFDKNGKLYVNTKAPDGHKVNKEGQWIKNTKVQHIKGKGLPLKPIDFKLKLKKIKDISSISKNNNNYNSYGGGGNSSNNNTNKSQYTVVFDFNDSITSSQSSTVNAGEYVQPPYPSPKQDYYFLGWYKEKEPQDLYAPFVFHETPINKDMTLYGVWIDTKNDTDGDGLVDGTEQILKTDIHKIDTDNDGLTDYQEYYYTLSNPTEAESIAKGILDSEVDMDVDGLTNKEEVEFGSNPILKDEDKDELNDLQEKQYGTNPNNKDTDDDGLLDGLEIKYGFNPLKPDTNGNGILDKDEIITVDVNYQGEGTSKPKANIKLKASSADNLFIQRDDPQESIWMPKEVPGLLDAAYDFNTSGEIEEATLTFHFEDKYTKSDEFEPAIYYIDTQNQEMILLDEQIIDWDNHAVTAKTTHFSKYALLNKKEQEKAWKKDISSSIISKPNARIEVAFVIDESGSMADNDPKKIRVDVAKQFIDTLRAGDKASVIGFCYYAQTYQFMTDNLNKAKDSLQNISNDRGGTDLRVGLDKALKEFPEAKKDENARESAMKIIVFLTDGQGTYDKSYEQTAIERGVKIYTVGLGKSYDQGLLKSIAKNTSGKFYHAGNANDLIEEFKKLTQDTIDIVSDKDHDGLSDYHEERIRLFNGVIIKLDKSNPDTDGDTLKDGQEIVQQTDKFGERVFFKLKSYPHKKDSDGDKINDNLDKRPLIPDLYKIDYLGSPKHLQYFEDRMNKKKKGNEYALADSEGRTFLKGYWGIDFLMEDYYTFLAQKGIDYTKGYREDYWKDEWDKYWGEYCKKVNDCVLLYQAVPEDVHYFRNNLNRIPKNLTQLNKEADKWVILKMSASVYHMYQTDFSGDGTYNLKFISKDGKHEGVYVNFYGKENFNKNKGLACTEKTDSKNMGTYNFDGMYYSIDLNIVVSALNHYLFDMQPYYAFGNTSRNDLEKKGESTDDNKIRYDKNEDAKSARDFFVKYWKGIVN